MLRRQWQNEMHATSMLSITVNVNMCSLFCGSQYSPEGQVSEEGDRQEDSRNSTADVCDETKDGGLETTGRGLSGEIL